MDSTWTNHQFPPTLDLTIAPHSFSNETLILRDLEGVQLNVERNSPRKEKSERDMEAKLNRVTEENKRLSELLVAMSASCSALHNRLSDYMLHSSATSPPDRKDRSISPPAAGNKRKSLDRIESPSGEDYSKRFKDDIERPKTYKCYVRTDPSNTTMVVKDGYQWRKYGQKVTRDNPSPRAYFRCSFSPSCPVKKKLQRSAEDKSILVATYEGEHNHACPLQDGISHVLHQIPRPLSVNSSGAAIMVDMVQRPDDIGSGTQGFQIESPEIRRQLVEQMVSSLAKDPGFTAALATEICGRILHHHPQA